MSHLTSNPITSGAHDESMLLRIGGMLGIGACIIGLAIFMASCAGFEAAMMFSPICVAFGSVGLVLSVMGGTCHKTAGNEVTHELAAVALSLWGILGGLVVMAAWLQWPVFASGH